MKTSILVFPSHSSSRPHALLRRLARRGPEVDSGHPRWPNERSSSAVWVTGQNFTVVYSISLHFHERCDAYLAYPPRAQCIGNKHRTGDSRLDDQFCIAVSCALRLMELLQGISLIIPEPQRHVRFLRRSIVSAIVSIAGHRIFSVTDTLFALNTRREL